MPGSHTGATQPLNEAAPAAPASAPGPDTFKNSNGATNKPKLSGAQSWRDLIKVHPAADLFPMMSDSEIDDLAKDIDGHGIKVPLVFWTPTRREDLPSRGKNQYLKELYLLDGRNRVEASWRLTEPEYRKEDMLELVAAAAERHRGTTELLYGEDDPWAFVISANLKRRHLDASQRAMVAAKIATARQGERTDLAPIGARSDADAAQLLNVGERSVERAKAVNRGGVPELVQAVERGEIAVSTAADIARKPLEEQREIISRPAPAEARKIAEETGVPTSARDGRTHAPRAKGPSKLDQIRALREANADRQAVASAIVPAPGQSKPQGDRAAADAVSPKMRERYFDAAELMTLAKVIQANPDAPAAWPLAKRVALARGCLDALKVSLDDLRGDG